MRASSGRLLGGVALGIARYTGISAAIIRLLFFVLAVSGGVGVAAYAIFWVFLPQEDGQRFRTDYRAQGQLLGLLAVAGVGIVLLATSGLLPGRGTAVPAVAAMVGIVLVWQQADESQRRRWREATAGRGAVLRIGLGALLFTAGAVGFLASRGQLAVARAGLLSTLVVVAGLLLLLSPWWFAMATDLRAERRERIRSQERADIAAHLHDSVLQTLALIQKAATTPAEVTRLARSQERELRTWLYAGGASEGSLTAALRAVAADVEAAHQIPVDVVTVGDLELDPRSSALVAAAREAVVNAARHSAATSIDVFAEVEPALVTVFVRDRGCGFDPAEVPADRHGLSGSVMGRMARHGGSASVRSAAGEGTEVRLELPRS